MKLVIKIETGGIDPEFARQVAAELVKLANRLLDAAGNTNEGGS